MCLTRHYVMTDCKLSPQLGQAIPCGAVIWSACHLGNTLASGHRLARVIKVCDLRSSWFVTLSYRRRAVERSGSTGPTTLSHLALRAGSSTTMMACDEPARVNNFGHFQTFYNYLINLNRVIGSPTTYFPFIFSLSAFLLKKKIF